MKRFLGILLGLATATSAMAYDGTSFQAFSEVGYTKIKIVREGTDEKSDGLNFTGPRLDGQWKDFSFVFTPDDDGTLAIRFGPQGRGDIPFEFDEIRVNGVPLDGNDWTFYPASIEGGHMALITSGKDEPLVLKTYSGNGAMKFIKVKKGERTEISMRGKSGSVLDAYIARLFVIKTNIEESMKAGSALEGSALAYGRQLAESLNALSVLAEAKLSVSVPPLALEGLSLETLKAKTMELADAFEAEKQRTADEEHPVLYDKPEDREEVRAAVIQAIALSSQLQTGCLLEFMLRH